jgi:hypothetical protein
MPAVDRHPKRAGAINHRWARLRWRREQLGEHLFARLDGHFLDAVALRHCVGGGRARGVQHDVDAHSEVTVLRIGRQPALDLVLDNDWHVWAVSRLVVDDPDRNAKGSPGVLNERLEACLRRMRFDRTQRGVCMEEHDVASAGNLTADGHRQFCEIHASRGAEDRGARPVGDRCGGGREAGCVHGREHDRRGTARARQPKRHVEAVRARHRRGRAGQQHDRTVAHATQFARILDQRHALDYRVGSGANEIPEKRHKRRRVDELPE